MQCTMGDLKNPGYITIIVTTPSQILSLILTKPTSHVYRIILANNFFLFF